MPNASPEPADHAERHDRRPLDIGTMRVTVQHLLAADTTLPRYDDLQDTLLLLRGHLALIVPEVETLAQARSDGDALRTPALITVGHTRTRLDAGPGSGLVSAVRHAHGLARQLRSLCDHYEGLTATTQAGQPT